MATTVTVFDPATGNTRSIIVDMVVNIIEQDLDGQFDYFMTLSTSAKKISGAAIPRKMISALDDLARGATQQDGITSTPYANLTAAVTDFIWNVIDGTGGTDRMSFTI